jgi:predicted ATPase
MRSRKPTKSHSAIDLPGYIRALTISCDRVPSWDEYPYNIPSIRKLGLLKLHPKVTYFIGENGSGKSTLLEAIAVRAGLNAEGGSRNLQFSTRSTESPLCDTLQLVRGTWRERTSYFLRAESLYNVASRIDALDEDPDGGGPPVIGSYGGKSLHKQSHGESFIALFNHRFGEDGLYMLDEPEAALSISRQFALLHLIDRHVQRANSQFIIATHSPVLLAYPDALIYQLDEKGIRKIAYEDAESYQLTVDFLNNREQYLRELCPELFRETV